jgi:hypothetical protein
MWTTLTKCTEPGSIKTPLGKACRDSDGWESEGECKRKTKFKERLGANMCTLQHVAEASDRGIGACARYAMQPIDRRSF